MEGSSSFRKRSGENRDYSRDSQPRQNGGSSAPASLRVPPHSAQSEEAVLGGILLDNEAINAALEKLRPEDFYRASHRAIFTAMVALSDKREPIDIVTLSSQLRSMNLLDESGGIDNLTKLTGSVPSAANVGYYAKNVRELSLRRRVISEATQIINEAFEAEGDVEDFIDTTESRILGVSEMRSAKAFHRVGDVVQDSIRLIERLYDRKDPITGTPTGFDDLNKLTAGFQKSDLVILAARPAMGKTALALNFASNVGIRSKLPVAIFSLEMSKEQLVLRMLCSEARVDSSRVRTGALSEHDFPRLVSAASNIAEAPIFIDDTPALTITELKAKCRRLHREHPLGLILIDYLQLMRSPMYASTSREQEISDISRSLKAIAKELNVPVIALSQLNRSLESRDNKRPVMSDLRESGAIEQDADIIMFIYRDEVYNPETTERGIAEVIIGKHRAGPTGVVRLSFLGEYTRFEGLSERQDVPGEEGAAATASPSADDFAGLDSELF